MALSAKQQQNLAKALEQLVWRIEQGEEFPDACGATALWFQIPHDALRDAYDEQELAGERERMVVQHKLARLGNRY